VRTTPDPTEDTYLSVAAVAKHLSVSNRMVMRWVYAEHHPLPAVKVGGLYVIPARAYSAWLHSRHVTP